MKKTSANIPDDLEREARRKAVELGLYEWQAIVTRALEDWVRGSTPAIEDPRLARVIAFLSLPGNLDRLEQFLSALTKKA
jgi:hypothetical protein